MDDHIKETGTYQVIAHLHADVQFPITVEVSRFLIPAAITATRSWWPVRRVGPATDRDLHSGSPQFTRWPQVIHRQSAGLYLWIATGHGVQDDRRWLTQPSVMVTNRVCGCHRTASRPRSRSSGRCSCRSTPSPRWPMSSVRQDFYKPAHRHIFEAIQSLYGSGTGCRSGHRGGGAGRGQRARRGRGRRDPGDPAGVARRPSPTPLHYARIVEEKALLRRLITTASDVAELGLLPARHHRQDHRLGREHGVRGRPAPEHRHPGAPVTVARTTAWSGSSSCTRRGDSITGTPTGYTDLDHLLAGLQPGALIIVGARPAMGKTAFALGIAAHASVREQLPVLFFSLEMGHLELTKRLIASEARIDATKLAHRAAHRRRLDQDHQGDRPARRGSAVDRRQPGAHR